MNSLAMRWRQILLVLVLMVTLPVFSQVITSSDFTTSTVDGISIHVHRKIATQPSKIPVLLVHGTWTSGAVWDYPGRSVMDYLATREYDVYALDLRGMGSSDRPDFSKVDVISRVQDVAAVAAYIAATTGRPPVVMGWSQGGIITGLLAASVPQLISGVGFISVAPNGFTVPSQFIPLLQSVIATGVSSYLPTADVIYALAFGFDPITGQPTISADAFATFVAGTEPDSINAILELGSPVFFSQAGVLAAWPAIKVPALVADGELDVLVGEDNSNVLYDALGSARKELIIFPRNAHAWFVEDNYDATMRAFDRFLAQF